MRSVTPLRAVLRIAAILLGCAALPAQAQYQAAKHESGWPGLVSGESQEEARASLALGPELQRGRPAKEMLADSRRLEHALAGLQPQRKGVVDAYVVSVALDSDPVFGREAREAGKVLSRRFDAAGRTITLAGTDGSGPTQLPNGSLTSLTLALARVAVEVAGIRDEMGARAHYDAPDRLGSKPMIAHEREHAVDRGRVAAHHGIRLDHAVTHGEVAAEIARHPLGPHVLPVGAEEPAASLERRMRTA